MIIVVDIFGTYKALFVAALGTCDFVTAVGFEEGELAGIASADQGS
jgi:hypothetical protein